MSQVVLYITALCFQIGATYFFIRLAKAVDLPRVNPFTIAFTIIVVRRVIVIFLKSLLPPDTQSVIDYSDANLVPVVFSLLLLIGSIQLYAKTSRLKLHK